MTKEELLNIIEEESNVYEEWQKHNNDLEYLPEAINKAFDRVKEAVKEYCKE